MMHSLQIKRVIGSSTPLRDCGFNMLLIGATLPDASSRAGTGGPGDRCRRHAGPRRRGCPIRRAHKPELCRGEGVCLPLRDNVEPMSLGRIAFLLLTAAVYSILPHHSA